MIPPEFVPKANSPQHRLLMELASHLKGLNAEWIIWAVLNLLINVMRHKYPNRRDAEDRFDELSARTKAMLMSHYDQHDRRRAIVPIETVQ